MIYTTRTDKETTALGKKFATTLRGGDIVCLYGDLGAGKTTLVKGIAAGLGIKNNITSPTFALMNVYPVKQLIFIHIDTYRLKTAQELVEIGAEDYLGAPGAICVIEWPEKIKKLLKNKKTVDITIGHKDVKTRTVKIS